MKLHLDFECFSPASIDAGDYFLHPDFAVTVIAWAFDNGPVKSLVWPKTDFLPEEIITHLATGGTLCAHNAKYEHGVITQHYGEVCPMESLECTMERAFAWGLPGALLDAGKALGLAVIKDETEHDLMMAMAKPPKKGKPIHETDPVKLARLQAYCVQDVEAERALGEAIPGDILSDFEKRVSLLTARSNSKGFLIDVATVKTLQVLVNAVIADFNVELNHLTGGAVTSGTQLPSLKAWLLAHGVDLPSITKETVAGALAGTLSPPARRALEIRALSGKTSLGKLPKMLKVAGPDDRARNQIQYYGAGRTGRWAGRAIQPQNLPKPHERGFDAAMALEGIIMFDALPPDNPLAVVASCLRPCIIAKPGHILMSLDLAQIEARVVAWLAGQENVLDLYRRGADVYATVAKALGSSDRNLGKAATLSLGFGAGGEKFVSMAAQYGVVLTLGEAVAVVQAWRAQNPKITGLWSQMESGALGTIGIRNQRWDEYGRGSVGGITYAGASGQIAMKVVGRAMGMRKPSGGKLWYHNPRSAPGRYDVDFVFDGPGRDSGTWQGIQVWGGHLVENITQATARDIMAEAILRIYDRYGYIPIMTVHDEAVYEIADDLAVQAVLRATFEEVPSWASGLPIASDTKCGRRYTK